MYHDRNGQLTKGYKMKYYGTRSKAIQAGKQFIKNNVVNCKEFYIGIVKGGLWEGFYYFSPDVMGSFEKIAL